MSEEDSLLFRRPPISRRKCFDEQGRVMRKRTSVNSSLHTHVKFATNTGRGYVAFVYLLCS